MLTLERHLQESRLRGALAGARQDLAEVEAGLDDEEPVPHEHRLALRRRIVAELERRLVEVGAGDNS